MSGAVSSIHGGFRRSMTTGGLRRLEIRVDGDEYVRIEKDNHVLINSVKDGKNVRINSRNVTQTSGDHSGVQIKPNQTAATAGITGLEVSPRYASTIAGTNLIGIKCDPVLKGTGGGNLSGEVTAYQANIDFGTAGTRTITGDISALDCFLAIPSGNTYDGDTAFLRIKTVNIVAWDYFLNCDDANVGAVTVSADGMNKNPHTDNEAGFIKILIASTAYEVPFYDVA